jgi:hypothetical protein
MIFHAYRILLRRRLLAAAFIALLVPAFFVLIAANLCDCGADAVTNKLKIVLASLSIASLFLGVIFGVGAAIHAPGVPNQPRFLLTRPIPLLAIQFYPLAIVTAAIAVLPALGWSAVLGVLWLAPAPMLQRLATVVEAYPQVLSLGSHPSLSAMLAAMQTGRRYLAAVSVGLAVFTLFAMLRSCVASTNKRLRQIAILGLVPLPLLLLFTSFLWNSSISQAILLVQVRHGSPDYVPSNLGIALHFVFAAACICAQFAVMRDIEI